MMQAKSDSRQQSSETHGDMPRRAVARSMRQRVQDSRAAEGVHFVPPPPAAEAPQDPDPLEGW